MASATSELPTFETTVRPVVPIDLALTLGELLNGPRDPTMRLDARGAYWRATRTPLGVATMRIAADHTGRISVHAWGEGAEWAVAAAPDIVGANDLAEGFAPKGKLLDLHRRFAGMRITRTRAVYEAIVPAICGQKVTSVEAYRSYAGIVRAWGEPAPHGLLAVPGPTVLSGVAHHDLRGHGIEMRRASTLRGVARLAARLEEAAAMPHSEARRRLEAIPGIGPWTAAKVALVALGDADAVPLGDYHLPNVVAFAFTGRARGTDAGMLELLAPFAGHRGRVIRLLGAAGIAAPKFGPRRRLRPVDR